MFVLETKTTNCEPNVIPVIRLEGLLINNSISTLEHFSACVTYLSFECFFISWILHTLLNINTFFCRHFGLFEAFLKTAVLHVLRKTSKRPKYWRKIVLMPNSVRKISEMKNIRHWNTSRRQWSYLGSRRNYASQRKLMMHKEPIIGWLNENSSLVQE